MQVQTDQFELGERPKLNFDVIEFVYLCSDKNSLRGKHLNSVIQKLEQLQESDALPLDECFTSFFQECHLVELSSISHQ